MVGGSTKRDSYIQFVTNAATGGTLIKSISRIMQNKTPQSYLFCGVFYKGVKVCR